MTGLPGYFFSVVLIICIPIILLSSCKSSDQTSSSKNKISGDSLSVYLERGICFGKCPVYSIHIYNTGYVVYHGKLNVELIGTYFSYIDKSILESINIKASETGYWNLESEYINPKLTDFPTIKSSLSFNNKTIKIIRYTESPPANLLQLEDYIDSVIENIKNWSVITENQPNKETN